MQYSFDSMKVVKYCEFGLKMPTDAHPLQKFITEFTDTQKALMFAEARRLNINS